MNNDRRMNEDSTLGPSGNEGLRGALPPVGTKFAATRRAVFLSGTEAVDSAAAKLMFDAVDPVDVALLKARYIAAFECYLALATKLAEMTESGGAPLVQLLEDERKALEEFAAVRGAMLVALAMYGPQIGLSLVAETRDEVIRRSIAKRDQGSLDTPARKRRLNRPRRIA